MSTQAEHIVDALLSAPTPSEREVMVQDLCHAFSEMFHVAVEPADLADLAPNELIALYYRHAKGFSLENTGAQVPGAKSGGPVSRHFVSVLLTRGMRKVVAHLSPDMPLTPEMLHGK
jgi:hypothetical protein